MVNGTNYNDGIKFASVYEDEYESISGYSDINENVYFEDYGFSYFYYHYNLGYLSTISNNGDTLDYSLDNYEDQRVFSQQLKMYLVIFPCFFNKNINCETRLHLA